MSTRSALHAALSGLLLLGSVSLGQAAPALGTIGIDSTGGLRAVENVDEGTRLQGGWLVALADVLVRKHVGDFDADGFDDFIIRSAWGMGIVGVDASNTLVTKALTPYQTDIGQGWILRPEDRVVAVGRFGSTSAPAQMVLKGRAGFAFVRRNGNALQAVRVLGYDTWVSGGGVGWRVGSGDRVLGVGRLKGVARLSGRDEQLGLGRLGTQRQRRPHPPQHRPERHLVRQLEARHQGSEARVLGVSDIDQKGDNRAEMVVVSQSGLAVLHHKVSPTSIWGAAAMATNDPPTRRGAVLQGQRC